MHPTECELDVIKSQISQTRQLEDDSFKIVCTNKLNAMLYHNGEQERKSYTTCYVSELRTLITPTGYYICPYYRGNKKGKYGETAKSGIAKQWNSIERKAVLHNINPMIECDFFCGRHDVNTAIRNIQQGKCAKAIRQEVEEDYDLFL